MSYAQFLIELAWRLEHAGHGDDSDPATLRLIAADLLATTVSPPELVERIGKAMDRLNEVSS